MARHAEQFRAQEKEREREAAEKSRENLEKARLAARCEHILLDGRRCRSPRMKDSTLCYWHDQMERTKAEKLDLGPMEDPDSIQIAIRKLQAAVIDGSLEKAGFAARLSHPACCMECDADQSYRKDDGKRRVRPLKAITTDTDRIDGKYSDIAKVPILLEQGWRRQERLRCNLSRRCASGIFFEKGIQFSASAKQIAAAGGRR
ncbi:MAG: hypothetical protein ACRD4I_10320 [Candidatus Angelobacter sp.]